MKRDLALIQGAGGGGGGGSEASDTLRGSQTFEVLDLISEGECEGLVDGFRSIYLDGVPLMAADGTLNFDNVSIQTTPGTQGQPAIYGVDGVQNEIGVGINVVYATPLTRSIANPAIDTCRVTIVVPQLSKADPDTGDLGGSSFEWAVEVQSAGGGYVQVFHEVVSGKTMSRYPRATLFKLTGPAPWDIKVRRLSADSGSANDVNAFAWATYTEIQTVKLRYPNSCLVRSRGNAAQFARIPVRSFDWLGMRIQVPNNYDPKTRVYSGVWDGTFKIAWTDNPAWQYHDMVVNNRYGLGRYIATTDAFKWELYAIGRYCDELVPDGYGGMEPRFRASPGFETRQQAYKVLTDMAAIFRGIVFWLNQDVSLAQDAPSDPVAHYSPANVMGEPGRYFAYAGSSNGKRYSSVIVWFNDLAQQGKLIPEVVIDRDLEAEIGVKPLELSPMGLWSRGQAHRVGQWVLYRQERETEGVTFKVGMDGVLVQPGKLFQISDPHEAGDRLAGRISAATASVVTLDADVTLEAGHTYLLSVMLQHPTDATKLVPQQRAVGTGAGTWRSLTMAAPFSSAPARETMWLLQSDLIVATTWRCIGLVDTPGENSFTISGIAHEPAKYALIEQGIAFDKALVSRLSPKAPTPTNMRFVETRYLSGSLTRSRISVSWESTQLGLSYLVSWRLNNGPITDMPPTSSNTVDIDGPAVGTFDVTVRSRNALGNISAPLTGSTTLVVDNDVLLLWSELKNRPIDLFNMVVTPQFEGGSSGGWAGSVVAVAGQAWSKALLSNLRDNIAFDSVTPISANETVYCYATLDTTGTAYGMGIGALFLDKTGAIIPYFPLGGEVAAGTAWRRVGGKVVAHPNAVSVVPWVQVQGVSGFGSPLVTNIYVGRASPGATEGADWDSNVANIPYASVYNNDDSVALGFSQENWPLGTSYPVGWGQWADAIAPIRETTIVRAGNSSVRYVVTGGNVGMVHTADFRNAPLPAGTFMAGNVDMLLAARSAGLPGVLVRVFTDATFSGYQEVFVQPSATLGVFQRLPWSLRSGAAGTRIYGIQAYFMASPDGRAPDFSGDVVFDNFMFALYDNSTDNRSINLNPDGTATGGVTGAVSLTGLGAGGLATLNTVDTAQIAPGAVSRTVTFVDAAGIFYSPSA